MTHALDSSLAEVARSLRSGECSAVELTQEAIRRHEARGQLLHAYKLFDPEVALRHARAADTTLASGDAPPLCGIPTSIKDLYGTAEWPTHAGTARELPDGWRRNAWFLERFLAQGAVPMGKTHTVELAYGAVGINPHWGTPRNPHDAEVHRIPGGSSCGAGVSLHEGSALVALGSDTGGSIRIPASMTGVVGHKPTHGLWSTDGVVPLSTTLDSVGALTRSAADAVYVFDALSAAAPDDGWGAGTPVRVGLPTGRIWNETQPDIADGLRAALGILRESGWQPTQVDGHVLDSAGDLYMTGGITGAECRAFLDRELPGWFEHLHPTVGERLKTAPPLDGERYRASIARRAELMAEASSLWDRVDVLALPGHMITPPPVAELDELDVYVEVNRTALQPTCPASMLGWCAVTVPVGFDEAGLPIGLQLVMPGGRDRALLDLAVEVERALV